jgi:coiled-coil domain-containing protein 61
MYDPGGHNTMTVDMTFHGLAYIMTVSTIDDTLVLHAEERETGDRWRGQFSSRYIEEITHKTGNYKKFSVFVKMLMSSMTTESDSVFVDLLTYSDLELLKSRKTGRQGSAAANSSSKNNKRYLIMTYAVEFDRVHYPLPLNYEDSPDPNHLKQTISRLRAELAQARASSSSAAASSEVYGAGDSGAMRAQLERERRAREQAESSLASGRREHQRALAQIQQVRDASPSHPLPGTGDCGEARCTCSGRLRVVGGGHGER